MSKRMRKLAGLTEAFDTRDIDVILRQTSDSGRDFEKVAETISMIGQKMFVGSTLTEIVEMFDEAGEQVDTSAVESLSNSEVKTIGAIRAVYMPNQPIRIIMDMRTDGGILAFSLPTQNEGGEIYIDR